MAKQEHTADPRHAFDVASAHGLFVLAAPGVFSIGRAAKLNISNTCACCTPQPVLSGLQMHICFTQMET